MKLTESRRDELYNVSNGTARKVYDSVPIQETWSTDVINGELMRKGTRVSYKAIQGSLAHLASIGLIKESPKGYFRRIEVRAENKEQETMAANPVLSLPPKKNPFDVLQHKLMNLTRLSDQFKTAIAEVSDELLTLQVHQEEESKKYQKIAELLDAIGSLKK